MKNLIRNLVAISLIVNCSLLTHADPMDQAQEFVNSTLEQAKGAARNAAVEDFNFAITEVLRMSTTDADLKKITGDLLTEQAKLAAGLEGIANMSAENISRHKAEVERIFSNYEDLVRRRFDLSFRPGEARAEARKSLIFAQRVLTNYASTCKAGRGIGGLGGNAFYYPDLPKANYSYKVSVGNGTDNSASIEDSQTGSQAEKNRNNVANVALGAAGYTVSFAASGGGALASACAAAAPFAVAGGAVIALAALYMNHMDRVKAENAIVEAKIFAFHGAANDEDVGRFYREECASMSNDARGISDVLQAAINDPKQLELLAGKVDFDKDMVEFQKVIQEHSEVRLEIEKLLKQRESAPSAEIDAALTTKNTKLKELGKKVAAFSTPEKIAQMMAHFLLNRRDLIDGQLSQNSWVHVDMIQRKAYRQIEKLMALVQRKNFSKFLNGTDAIGAEIKAAAQFESLRSQFKEVLTLQVRFIFDRVEASKVAAAENILKTGARQLISKFGQDREVAEFARQVRALVGDF